MMSKKKYIYSLIIRKLLIIRSFVFYNCFLNIIKKTYTQSINEINEI